MIILTTTIRFLLNFSAVYLGMGAYSTQIHNTLPMTTLNLMRDMTIQQMEEVKVS